MRPTWIIGLAILTLTSGDSVLLASQSESVPVALEETRVALHQQGFKVDLTEFDFSATPEQRACATALTNADLSAIPATPSNTNLARRLETRIEFNGATAAITNGDFQTFLLGGDKAARRAILWQEEPELLPVAGPNAAVVIWKERKLGPRSDPIPVTEQARANEDLWPVMRQALNENQAVLDAACQASLSGPIRFDLDASRGSAILLRHLSVLNRLARVLGIRAIVELGEGNKDAAWTNLLASTRLLTAWDTEPIEVSQLVRCGDVSIVFNTTWQVLQSDAWAEDRLAQLQREWEAVDFFQKLPETQAFLRASYKDICQRERQEPLPPHFRLADLRNGPQYAWTGFLDRWREASYRHDGSYEDERALLLYYRDRELEFRRAVQAPNWLEMRRLPGVTNSVPFRSKFNSGVVALMNLKQISSRIMGRGRNLFEHAAEAESRRRLLVTAIALERYRRLHGACPRTLAALAPELLDRPPVDFIDGQPLRYHPTPDGRFVLYSIGLDCENNGGDMRRPQKGAPNYPLRFQFGIPRGTDLVWPRPASDAEVRAYEKELRALEEAERINPYNPYRR